MKCANLIHDPHRPRIFHFPKPAVERGRERELPRSDAMHDQIDGGLYYALHLEAAQHGDEPFDEPPPAVVDDPKVDLDLLTGNERPSA